jgi:hypothetical protein
MFVDIIENASTFRDGSRYFLFNNWARYSTSIESIHFLLPGQHHVNPRHVRWLEMDMNMLFS